MCGRVRRATAAGVPDLRGRTAVGSGRRPALDRPAGIGGGRPALDGQRIGTEPVGDRDRPGRRHRSAEQTGRDADRFAAVGSGGLRRRRDRRQGPRARTDPGHRRQPSAHVRRAGRMVTPPGGRPRAGQRERSRVGRSQRFRRRILVGKPHPHRPAGAPPDRRPLRRERGGALVRSRGWARCAAQR